MTDNRRSYLGDTLVHLSFPLLLYGSDMLAPIEILGAVVNYLFLRHVSGDKQNEADQARRYSENNPEKFKDFQKFKETQNSVWPKADVVTNKWFWIVIGAGAVGVALERTVHKFV